MDDWITTVEASQLSGYSTVHIRKLIKGGEIRAQKWGRDWQVSRESLVAYLKRIGDKGNKRGPKPKDIL